MASVQERLRAAMEPALSEPIHLPFPSSVDGSLVVRYRPVKDWAQVAPWANTEDPIKEQDAAADALLSACEGCEAHIDGEVTELPNKLGKALAAELGWSVDGVSDRQALYLMCPDTILIVGHFKVLLARSERATSRAKDAAEGESTAG